MYQTVRTFSIYLITYKQFSYLLNPKHEFWAPVVNPRGRALSLWTQLECHELNLQWHHSEAPVQSLEETSGRAQEITTLGVLIKNNNKSRCTSNLASDTRHWHWRNQNLVVTSMKKLVVKRWLSKEVKQFPCSLKCRVDLQKLWFSSALIATGVVSECLCRVATVLSCPREIDDFYSQTINTHKLLQWLTARHLIGHLVLPLSL